MRRKLIIKKSFSKVDNVYIQLFKHKTKLSNLSGQYKIGDLIKNDKPKKVEKDKNEDSTSAKLNLILKDIQRNNSYITNQFYEDMWHNIYLLSAYRSYKDQERLWNQWCTTARCAKNGWSEHQLWLAVDIHVADDKWWYAQFSSWYLDWMNENAYKYGYINTYRKWPKIDGKMNEIRHWRYVWVPFATELHEKDMSFAEWVNNNQ